MNGAKYIGMDVHKESISIAVRNSAGKTRSSHLAGTPLMHKYYC